MTSSGGYVYLAAPLFSAAELRFNVECALAIESVLPVFLPQRDGGLFTELLESGIDHHMAALRIARGDMQAIRESLGVVAVLDGQSIDEGVAFEIGYAHALRKPCIGYSTDSRRGALGFINPMVSIALLRCARSSEELVELVAATFLGPVPTDPDSGQALGMTPQVAKRRAE